ncbi:MAG: NAD-dependent epimerase/dehydratase family protein [Candidatus Helarchaeota archaeon]|nr:NAD-dependent epimerase/dehydratase family protein [Candidatus Helarchaeota archaeon]
MKFLVTGVNGFIGSNLAKKLVESDYEVRGLILEGTDESNLEKFADKIEKVYGDITDPNSIRTHFKGIDVVVHLAARAHDWGPEKLFQRINYEGSKNVLDAAVDASVKRFIFMSSLTVHGFEGFQNVDEETPYKPYNAYARSKKAVEDLLNDYFKQGKIETVIIRPGFTIFGPYDRLFSFEAYKRIEKGKSFPVVNKGKSLICYSYVENLVDGLILVATRPKAAGKTYIISDGPIIVFREFMEKMIKVCTNERKIKLRGIPSWLATKVAGFFKAIYRLGRRKKKRELILLNVPLWLAIIAAGFIEAIYKISRSNKGPLITKYRVKVSSTDLGFVNEKFVKELGYKAIVGIEEGFKRTYEWYKEEMERVT